MRILNLPHQYRNTETTLALWPSGESPLKIFLIIAVTMLDAKCSLVLVIWDPNAYKLSEKEPQK